MEPLLDVEKKLELMQQVRSRYEQDRNDLAHRESILYGKTGSQSYDPYRQEPGNTPAGSGLQNQEEQPLSAFALRILFSAGLFLLLLLCDISGKNFFGMPPEKCFQIIAQDYESSITRWVDAASHVTYDTDL
ncbi:MAG: hypothetical protein J6M66_10660 [Lachnospiraceae bacterium]|nr:hypothetical protein [Lachnospiraceae bacterium]